MYFQISWKKNAQLLSYTGKELTTLPNRTYTLRILQMTVKPLPML